MRYLKFIFRSTNQHGVHSPFVYNLITKCFYNKQKKKSYPYIKSIYNKRTIGLTIKNAYLINRLLPYLEYKTIFLAKGSPNTINKILSTENTIEISHSIEERETFDMIYWDLEDYKDNDKLLEKLFSVTHNDSLLLINGIHTSIENTTIWNNLKKHPTIIVTIDIFALGFVFFRKEQAKEHFNIRT